MKRQNYELFIYVRGLGVAGNIELLKKILSSISASEEFILRNPSIDQVRGLIRVPDIDSSLKIGQIMRQMRHNLLLVKQQNPDTLITLHFASRAHIMSV